MGSGKTTVSQQLGQLLQLPILEMDQLVFQKTHSKDMHEVFTKGGELLLRQTEVAIAQEHAYLTHHIVSTGAGVVQNKIILDYLKKESDKIVFLNATFPTIVSRLFGDATRPLFQNLAEAEALYHFRQPLYLRYADQTVVVDHSSPLQIAQEIINQVNKDQRSQLQK